MAMAIVQNNNDRDNWPVKKGVSSCRWSYTVCHRVLYCIFASTLVFFGCLLWHHLPLQ